jgi:hypothetical protein
MGGQANGGKAASCLVPASEAALPALLSLTGCVDMDDPGRAAPGLIRYAVSSPLWSDGAMKERFLKVPEGATIRVKDCDVEPDTCKSVDDGGTATDEGHWELPIGSVLVKSFSLASQRVETRLLFQRGERDWIGASYEWNDAGTDATLLEGEKDKIVGAEPAWHFPSRSQCFQCHTRGAGISLGPSTQQLDFVLDYAEGAMNQIDKLVALGWLGARPKALTRYPNPALAGDIEPRARAYLQANCSMCHRPGGTISDVDLRFSTPLSAMGLCNQNIERGTGDPVLPQKRLVPGHPELSSLSFRVRDLGLYRMPKIGSARLDPEGAQLLDDWISSLTACP